MNTPTSPIRRCLWVPRWSYLPNCRTAELPAGAQVLAKEGGFRLPLRLCDGCERVVLASMAEGIIRFSVHFEDSRVWEVTETMVNSCASRASRYLPWDLS